MPLLRELSAALPAAAGEPTRGARVQLQTAGGFTRQTKGGRLGGPLFSVSTEARRLVTRIRTAWLRQDCRGKCAGNDLALLLGRPRLRVRRRPDDMSLLTADVLVEAVARAAGVHAGVVQLEA